MYLGSCRPAKHVKVLLHQEEQHQTPRQRENRHGQYGVIFRQNAGYRYWQGEHEYHDLRRSGRWGITEADNADGTGNRGDRQHRQRHIAAQ
jgi:hypothetical protein